MYDKENVLDENLVSDIPEDELDEEDEPVTSTKNAEPEPGW